MSVFTSLVTKVLDSIPGAAGQTVTIRKLAPKQMQDAQFQSQLRSIEQLKQIGGPAFVRELQTLGGDARVQAEVRRDPLLAYDPGTLLRHGVLQWSFEVPCAVEAYDDLDEDVRDWIAREVLRLAKPSLFAASPAEALEGDEAARKNG